MSLCYEHTKRVPAYDIRGIKKHVAAVAALESEVGNPNAAVCGCMIEFRSDLLASSMLSTPSQISSGRSPVMASLSTSLVTSLCRGSACVYALHCSPSYTSPAACIAGHLLALVQPPSRF
ncbi:unnamed protein product [Boreogadus saida]